MTEFDIYKELCENDFAWFAKQALKVVEPETQFEWNWHMDTLCHYCERVYYGEINNLDIQIPPRTLKSLLVNVIFPAWIWTKKPSYKIISGSSSYKLSIQFNKKRRDLITSNFYQTLWPTAIKEDSNKADKFVNEHKGFMQAVSAMGKVTGEGADMLLSDDLIDAMDAFSKTKRDSTSVWFSQVFFNRVQDKRTAKRININQRLHPQDVSGNIEKNHPIFKRLVLPMQMTEAQKNKPLSTVDFVDPREVGEYIHPARYTEAEAESDKKALGTFGWASQMQQDPQGTGGGIIKSEHIRYYKELPKDLDRQIITGDLTFEGKEDSDYVSFMCWAKKGKDKYLVDLVRGKWSYKITKARFKDFCEKHPKAYEKFIENKANGPALISDMQSEMTGLKPWPRAGSPLIKASKVQRVHLCSTEFENGNVYLPEGIELVEVFVEELVSFTENGSTTGNDDMVDTTTTALLEFKTANTFFAA